MVKMKRMIVLGLEKAQFFHLVSKDIKPKVKSLFKLIKSFKEHQNLVVITVLKELRLLNVNLFPKLKIEESCNCVILV